MVHMRTEQITKSISDAFDIGFAEGQKMRDNHYRKLYGDDFEEILKNHDAGFKGLFSENGEER